jgi:hypothetical protein
MLDLEQLLEELVNRVTRDFLEHPETQEHQVLLVQVELLVQVPQVDKQAV